MPHHTPPTSTQLAIALVGMPGAGKTICAEHLRRRGYFTLRFGALVVEEVRRRGCEVNPANESVVREELRERHGMGAMAILSLPKLQAALERRRCVIIDGLYSLSEYKLLTESLPAPLVLVAVTAPRALRYQRLASRPERPLTPSEAHQRDFREIETLEKGGPIAMADYTLLNDGEPEALLRQLDALLGALGCLP